MSFCAFTDAPFGWLLVFVEGERPPWLGIRPCVSDYFAATLYDPASGTGGMLSIAEDHLRAMNPSATLKVYGQEINPESYAICKSDMLIKGQDAGNIKFGNSFTQDGLAGETFDYMLSNPPFGVDWKKYEDAVRGEHESLGMGGRFGAGLPRVRELGAGRLLVSPTVWEDMVKTLMTTNTTWNVTVQMVRRVADLGDPAINGKAFPTSVQIARMNADDLAARVRAGYRTAYLHEFAKAVADGKIDPESWRNPDLPSDDLYRQIRSVKGFGDYAAGTMLRLLGRFDRLGIDTACRGVFKEQLNGGEKPSDDTIRRYYEPFGEWRGLVMWMDVMMVNMTAQLAETTR